MNITTITFSAFFSNIFCPHIRTSICWSCGSCGNSCSDIACCCGWDSCHPSSFSVRCISNPYIGRYAIEIVNAFYWGFSIFSICTFNQSPFIFCRICTIGFCMVSILSHVFFVGSYCSVKSSFTICRISISNVNITIISWNTVFSNVFSPGVCACGSWGF